MLIKDMNINNQIDTNLLLRNVEFKTTQTSKQYANLTFGDKSGTIQAKLWNVDDNMKTQLKKGSIYQVKGRVDSYNSQKQLIINDYLMVSSDPNEAKDYLAHVELTDTTFNQTINQAIGYLQKKNPHYAELVKIVMDQPRLRKVVNLVTENDFQNTPYKSVSKSTGTASALVGGLAYHTYRMLMLTSAICKQYPSLNQALLITATILRQIGKMQSISNMIEQQPTIQGTLLGQTAIGDGWIITLAEKQLNIPANSEDIVLLRHCLLAKRSPSYYQRDDTPIPKIPEAAILTELEFIDDTMRAFEQAYAITEAGHMSLPIPELNGNSIYKQFGDSRLLDLADEQDKVSSNDPIFGSSLN